MTEKQKQVLLFISEYIKNNGFTPSYQEMCDELGIKSKSHIHNIVKNLEQQGYIQSIRGKKRSISIVSQNKDKKIKKLKAENTQLRKWCEEFNALDIAEENEQLKTKLSIQCEANEELRKENQQLKELLRDLADEADGALQAIQKDCESDDWSIFRYPEVQYFYDLKTKIDNAIGEKK